MYSMKYKKVSIIIAFVMIGSVVVLPNAIEADESNGLRSIRDFDGILTFTEGYRGDDPVEIQDYFLYDDFHGYWCDAEKTVEDTEDDVQCWAAAASNVLNWTGWGLGVESGIQDCDDIFQEFQDHWPDVGGMENNGWHWWINWSDCPGDDVAGGGNYYPTLDYSDYFHQTWYDKRASYDSCPADSYDLMQALDIYLHNGWGITLGYSYHAITAWGFSYNTSVDSSDFANYYTGVWVTDSDDDKGNDPDPLNPNEADEYPDSIRYYDIEFSGGKWNVLNYYGGSSAIESFFALEPRPNDAPNADAGANQNVNEGDTVNFDGSGSTDPDGDALTYSWDFGDGSSGSGVNPSHIYCDNAVYSVTLIVEDILGETDSDSMTVTVDNVAPTANLNNDGPVDEGSPVKISFTGQFEPGCDTITYSFDWENDGIYDIIDQTSSYASSSYCDDGIYTVKGRIKDDDGGYSEYTTDVIVNNADPVADAGFDQSVNENENVTFSGSIIDAGTCDDLTYEWDFGDASTLVTDTLTPTHVYGDDGVYTVTLTVNDDDGGSSIDTIYITVNNVDPIITSEIAMELPYPENQAFILPIVHDLKFTATAYDQGSDDLTFTWDWDDGSTDIITYYNDGTNPDLYPSPDIQPITKTDVTTHTYASPGTYHVTLTVTDDDGGVITALTYEVIVLDIESALDDINNYIQSLPNNIFKGNAILRKNAFNNMFNALDNMLFEAEYWGLIQDLSNNIRAKCDGYIDGNKLDDWINGKTTVGYNAQWHICSKIDDLISYIYTYI